MEGGLSPLISRLGPFSLAPDVLWLIGLNLFSALELVSADKAWVRDALDAWAALGVTMDALGQREIARTCQQEVLRIKMSA